MVGVGWRGWGGMVGDRGHYFLFTKFLEIFYKFKILCMVALDSLRHFREIFQNFLGREGGPLGDCMIF